MNDQFEKLAIQPTCLTRKELPEIFDATRPVEISEAEALSIPPGAEALSCVAAVIVANEACPVFRTLTIIVPVYNERSTVLAVLEKVLSQNTAPLNKELFVVDDCSTDGTRELLQKVDWESVSPDGSDRVRLLLHEHNRGKGACIRTALEQAKGELVLVQDADLEYDPGDYPALLLPILEGRADAVFGNRFHPEAHRVPRFHRFLLNRVFSVLCNMLTSLALTDVTACYKVLRRDLLDALKLECNRFSMETELTVKLSKTSARIHEVPIQYHGRTYAEGKKISWMDGLAAAYHLFRYRFF